MNNSVESISLDPSQADVKSAEIICVGSELLLGDILNGNAQYLAQQLASLGIAHHYQTVVGDNPTRIKRAVAIACKRARLIIFTGGLGPTPDDLTIETLADFFGADLSERAEIVADLKEKFAKRGRQLSAESRKQAQLPQGADILPNPVGTAPGVLWQPRSGLIVMTFPGVPWEMKAMWQASAIPYLHQNGWVDSVIHSQMLKFWGMGETTLARTVKDYLSAGNPTVATYALGGEVKLRISAKADSIEAANALINPVADEIYQLTGSACYGKDADTMADVVGQLLRAQGQTLSVAESCTGGGLGQLLTAVPGSSEYFLGGVISYDNRVKEGLLGVDASVLAQKGAVSAEVAAMMADGVRDRLGTDWGLSITGIAGPGGGSKEKPVGLVYIGLSVDIKAVDTKTVATGKLSATFTERFTFGEHLSREQIRMRSAVSALNLLRLKLLTKQSGNAI